MEKVKIPEINLTSDSDDLLDDYWFASPSASFDGSSVTSIPWADDVVKQNQDLWERVERMFYGEENLPTNDIKLRNEIIEWTNHFAYLRVTGEQMPIYFSNNNVIPSDPNYEEVFAVHPMTMSMTKAPTTTSISHANYPHGHRYPDDQQDNTLVDDIEKCLRITSGPLLSRRAQNSRTAYGVRSTIPSNQPETNFTQSVQNRNKHGLKSALVSVRSNYDMGAQFARKLYASFDVDRLHMVPYSARFIKIPTAKNESGDQNTVTATHKPSMIRIKTATLVPISRPLRNSITLPAINIEPKYFDRNTSDAISAVIYPSNTSTKSVTLSPLKSLKKRSESE